jgi:hypothetical protein
MTVVARSCDLAEKGQNRQPHSYQLKNEIEENPPPFRLAHQEGHHRIMTSIMMSNVRPIKNLLQRVADYDAIRHGIGNDDPWVQQQLVEANQLYMEFIEVWDLA